MADAIRKLTAADWARLGQVARRYVRPPMEWRDLLQEALARAIDSRTCPGHVDIVKFLAEAMRSIASGEAEKIAHRLPIVAVPKNGSQNAIVENVRSPEPTAEEELIQSAEEERIRSDILALFSDDPLARDLVEGLFVGLTADELRQLTGLDDTGYDTKRKLIRRRIDKAYPTGWMK
ncbi:MAG TPA: RNA polymerase subunit sigma-24 [Bauldia sp.]|nr:RNA polymerase subunit sigma-24 [Bauldia sp.]